MNQIKRLATLSAIFVAACGGGAVAQMMAEKANAVVHKNAPAQATFDTAILSRLKVPAGFTISLFASGLDNPRMMEVAADGSVYVTRRNLGDVLVLKDANRDGVSDGSTVFASGLEDVNGVAIFQSQLYLASSTTVWRTPLTTAAPQVILSGLPDGGQHPNRMVRFGPDNKMYVSIGSSCNDCAESNQLERATMNRYAPDGTGKEVLANGLRNTIGYDWNPRTGALWGMDHGSDFRGDTTPPEELNRIEAGKNYGWPICYANKVADDMTNAQPKLMALLPGQARPSLLPLTRSEYCAQTTGAVAATTAHSAPMAMRFYSGTRFPEAYRSDAFVAMRGSWNAGNPVGYKVVRVRFDASGAPTGFEDFVTGFIDEAGATQYGRPVGIAFTPDGAMLVSDDTNGAIYRVAYTGS